MNKKNIKTTNEWTRNVSTASFCFGAFASLRFVVYFVIPPFTSTNNLSLKNF